MIFDSWNYTMDELKKLVGMCGNPKALVLHSIRSLWIWIATWSPRCSRKKMTSKKEENSAKNNRNKSPHLSPNKANFRITSTSCRNPVTPLTSTMSTWPMVWRLPRPTWPRFSKRGSFAVMSDRANMTPIGTCLPKYARKMTLCFWMPSNFLNQKMRARGFRRCSPRGPIELIFHEMDLC